MANTSNLPSVKTFKYEDYPKSPEWFRNFLVSLNYFATPVYQIINGGITYQNTISPQIYTATVTAPAAGDTTFNFTNPIKIQPQAVLLGNIYEQGDSAAHPSLETCVYWHISQNVIYIDSIPNLTPSTTYVITLAIL